jgi:hypothetical protein
MANEMKMKLTGRVTQAVERTTNKDGVVLDRPYVQVTLEQVVVIQVRIIADPADLPRLTPLIGKEQDVDLPVVQSIDSTGAYAGRPNYRLDVPRAAK